MPKNHSKRSRKSKNAFFGPMLPTQGGDAFVQEPRGVITFPFRYVIAAAVSASTAVSVGSLNPVTSMGSRLASLAPNFVLWRLTKLRFTLSPNTQLSDVAFGYTGQPWDTASPNSFSQVLNASPISMVNGAFQSNPTAMVVPPRMLKRKAQPWLRTVFATGNMPEQYFGGSYSCYSRAAITGTIVIIVDGEVQFTQPAISGVTMPEEVNDELMNRRLASESSGQPPDVPSEDDEKYETFSAPKI